MAEDTAFGLSRIGQIRDLASSVELDRRTVRTMHKRFLSAMAIGYAALLMQACVIASSVPQKQAEEAATSFCRAIISPGGFSYWEFEGAVRQRMKSLLSKRLLASLDNTHACFRDWARRQPPDSTDKPPGVDCCVFSVYADWYPTSFALQKSEPLSDGRRRVIVNYQFDSPYEHARWDVAVYIVQEKGRYVVDDFEGGLDGPESSRWFVSQEVPECKQGKWVLPN